MNNLYDAKRSNFFLCETPEKKNRLFVNFWWFRFFNLSLFWLFCLLSISHFYWFLFCVFLYFIVLMSPRKTERYVHRKSESRKKWNYCHVKRDEIWWNVINRMCFCAYKKWDLYFCLSTSELRVFIILGR